jgi:hypothetical protein
MSFPEFLAAVDGWIKAHNGSANPPPPTDEEYEDMIKRFGP